MCSIVQVFPLSRGNEGVLEPHLPANLRVTNPPRDQSFVARQQFHSKVFQFIDPRQRVKSQLPQCSDALQGIVRIVLLPDEHAQHVHA